MRGVGREAAALRERLLEMREHVVHGLGQAVELVTRPGPLHALTEILRADPPCGPRHPIQGTERDLRDEGAAHRGQRDPDRDQHGQGVEIPIEGGPRATQQHADLNDLHDPALTDDRRREHADRLRVGEQDGLEGVLPAGRAGPRRGGQGQRGGPAGRWARTGATLGIQELEELVVELGSQQLPQPHLVIAGLPRRRAGVLDDLRDGEEGGVEILQQADAQPGIGQRADGHDDGQEDPAVPQRQPGADGERRKRPPHGSALRE